MKYFQFLSVLALTSAVAILPRDATQIKKDLMTIDTDIKNINSACTSWSGTPSTYSSISNPEKTFENDLKTANTDATNSAAVSSSDSASIISFINGTVEPDLSKALTCLVNKKAQLKASGFLATQIAELKTMKNLTETYGATLIGKSSQDQRNSAQNVGIKIDSDYNNAINTLSS